jgi:hypothetical protein
MAEAFGVSVLMPEAFPRPRERRKKKTEMRKWIKSDTTRESAQKDVTVLLEEMDRK